MNKQQFTKAYSRARKMCHLTGFPHTTDVTILQVITNKSKRDPLLRLRGLRNNIGDALYMYKRMKQGVLD